VSSAHGGLRAATRTRALLLSAKGRRRRQAPRAPGLVGGHAGRQGRAVPLGEAGVADGLDRFEERHWRRREEALARTVEADDHEPASPRAPVVRPPARQVIHRGYMAR
jgi:hypothetical protein